MYLTLRCACCCRCGIDLPRQDGGKLICPELGNCRAVCRVRKPLLAPVSTQSSRDPAAEVGGLTDLESRAFPSKHCTIEPNGNCASQSRISVLFKQNHVLLLVAWKREGGCCEMLRLLWPAFPPRPTVLLCSHVLRKLQA